ncbi:tail assembly protein [Collimonas pratensis]|uniref:tail assembly protein n=1 Tax=Collimonas pratensis TaxID=279113 RepID=UPI0007811A8F|nr:tail assembly protein [Collimonas pratensis]
MEKIRTIRLYGKLGTQFGRVHRFAVSSTGDAIRALCSMLPGFERELMSSADHGIGYSCFLGSRNISKDQLDSPIGSDEIRIAPILQGSKRAGIFQIIVGAILVVASFYPGLQGLAPMGYAMMLGGVVQMLSPQQTGLGSKDSPNNGASYNMNGAVNTQAQGNPEPLLYGEAIVGSVVVSGGIYAEDQQ